MALVFYDCDRLILSNNDGTRLSVETSLNIGNARVYLVRLLRSQLHLFFLRLLIEQTGRIVKATIDRRPAARHRIQD